ncbi:Beta sliding clamp [Paenibacillus solanacearum]|uniref:Beta sliding clamp n=1 Tax=Paenibacillus solanacearum TaxID=2048548 RepID=A0A916NYR0_9BACL|nr:DNA polymerase III subunit beta [Paenibacillus solanacearum]CAG7649226.1 Beta sliding clamp [Paenibacillus solanacearum]
MLFHIAQDELLRALQHVSRAADANSPIPSLSGIYVKADSRQLLFIAGSDRMTIQYRVSIEPGSCRCEVVRSGNVIIPANYVLEWVRKLPPGIVTVDTNQDLVVTIRSDAAVCRISGMNGAPYTPITRPSSAAASFLISNEALKRAIQQVAFAVSASETRPVLTGVFCKPSGTMLRLTASDSIRLATGQAEIRKERSNESADNALPQPFLVSGKALYDISKLIPSTTEMTRIFVAPEHVTVQTGPLEVSLTQLHGTYPAVDRLIPSAFVTEMVVSTAGLQSAIERMMLMSGEGHLVRIDSADAKTVRLASRTSGVGDVCELLPVQHLSGEAVAVCFNGKYMSDIVRTVGSEHVAIRFAGKWSPLLLQPADCSASQYLLTPIRTHA